ncbi:hypothetical protein UFOVP755_99 [uncultured Caudovirales phage]|jgi:hypothetical protein|uniref:Uncharacterized protein n=1 Tax=uncultured Caudovirales phage TaxID=2100421 RepID=A0A6J7X902_9CAUD|nr:hypothetical protein UFOVP755_99 [uncultured Caudovirales phage]
MSQETQEQQVEQEQPQSTTQETQEQAQQQSQNPNDALGLTPDDEIETAVLLVMTKKDKAILPVVNIGSLKTDRIASPREVYRMCLDVADQISSVSLLGELTNVQVALLKESNQQVSNLTAQKIAMALNRAVDGSNKQNG